MESAEKEFQKIYDDHYPRIVRYLRRLVGDSEAEDVAQEVFVKVHQSLDGFRGESKLSTWIYRIATNTAMDRLKSPSSKDRWSSLAMVRTLPSSLLLPMRMSWNAWF